MSAEFEAEVRNSMRALQATVEGLGRAQKKTTDEVARFGGVAQQAFRKPKTDADKLEEAAKKNAKSWREVGVALSRLGGPLGALAARFGGGFGMEGGLSSIAAAASVAGIAFKALSAVVQKQVEDAKNAAEVWRKLGDAIESAQESADAAASGAVAQAPDRRKVRAIGGEEGIEQLDALTEGGIVSESEGASGLAAIYGRYGRTDRARAAVSTARALAQTGIGFDQAGAALAKVGSDLTQPGVARATAGRIFNEHYGRLGGGAEGFNQALADTGGDAFLNQAAVTRGVEAQTAGVRRAAVTAGTAQVRARGELGAARNPASAAALKISALHEKEIALLQQMTALQSDIALNFKDMGVILGGEGSTDYQTMGKQRAFANGVNAYAP